jgi:hypothetical protein
MPSPVRVHHSFRQELEQRVRDKGAPARVAERARIVLLVGAGRPGKQIAATMRCAEPTVVTWRRRYAGRVGMLTAPVVDVLAIETEIEVDVP